MSDTSFSNNENDKKESPMSSAEATNPGHHDTQHHEPPQTNRGVLTIVVLVILIAAVVLAVLGILKRKHNASELEKYTDTTAAPTVMLEQPVMAQTAREIVLPGNIQAYQLAPIYARTTGYVKSWSHDIGSHVRKGELLAVIETPELDQQLAQAKADLATAQTNAGLAKTTADRYKDLIGKNAVSQQDTDNAANSLAASNTQVAAAQANVQRIQELVGFERVTAPFDGVVTARNIEVGQLISASGSTTTAGAGTVSANREIFDISANNRLRVFINVPQVYSPDAKNGALAELTLPQYPGRKFEGKLVRSSDAVDPGTRTLLAEVDVDNKTGELLPGSFTEVHLHVSNAAPALIVPVSALILTPDGLRIATVDDTNHLRMVRVVPGRDLGTQVEILSGLKPGQAIVGNPSDSLTDGEAVRVVKPNAGKAPEAK
ncbi:RND family efflux transporter, MFP subunit [Granulicella rosea]|uniref:RND family efflux transporter, MFP subunit n=1 Tax=Granulicella rosea TaxID=474952 RepID=A0A239MIE2_9BACT|nr:efflux RND transporter periplasmic adaptor subunit [Granulicella rosea]SNT41569.1 RND family efflux transporter, MFP subunit [Granulicella rosea]